MKYKLAICVLALLTSGAALAESADSGTSFWDQLDTDKDGLISREEASSMEGLAPLFDKIDTSKDGKLDSTEMKAIHGGAHGQDHAGGHTHGT